MYNIVLERGKSRSACPFFILLFKKKMGYINLKIEIHI